MKKNFFTLLIIVNLLLCSCSSDNTSVNNTNHFQYASLIANCYENGMIYGKSPIRYIDYHTMESSILCSKPNCNHQTSECVANIVGDCPIMYNGFLYYFTSYQGIEELGNGQREYRIKSKLCKVSLDSSEITEIVTFTDCKPREYDGWLILNNVVWFTGDNMNPTPDEYGNISASNQGGEHYICSIDLDSKKYSNYGSVYDGDKEYDEAAYTSSAQIYGYYDSKILIRYEFAKSKDTRGQDFRKRYTELMFEFDPKTKKLTESEYPMPSYVDNNAIVYTEYDKNKTFVIDNYETYELECDSDLKSWYTDKKLFLPSAGVWYDLTDMTIHNMSEYIGYGVIKYNESYIFFNGNKIVKLEETDLYDIK